MQIYQETLFFKASYNAKTNKSLIFCRLDSCGRRRARDWCTERERERETKRKREEHTPHSVSHTIQLKVSKKCAIKLDNQKKRADFNNNWSPPRRWNMNSPWSITQEVQSACHSWGKTTVCGSETWTLLADSEKRIQAFETKCLRKLLYDSYLEHKTDNSVQKGQLSCGTKGTSSGNYKKRELTRFGYVTCRDSL